MRKHIEGCLNNVEFTSTEPLAIAQKYIEVFPDNLAIASELMFWAWDSLTNKNIAEGTYQAQGIYMQIVSESVVQEPANIQEGLALIKEIGSMQKEYRCLLSNGGLTKKALCDLVIPFRDKYKLTDIDAISIVRNEKNFLEIAEILEKNILS